MEQPSFIDPSIYAHLPIPPDTERAWAAGFFDGEGWFGINAKKYLRLAVVQTEMTTLERFQSATGGHGTIYERSKNQPAHWSKGWCYQVNALGDVTHAVNLIWEYLCQPKRDQIAAAYEKRVAYRATWPAAFPLPQQRLSDDQVRQIQVLLAEGTLTQGQIGALFGVTNWAISKIKIGKRRTRTR